MKIFFPLEVFYPSQAGGPANSIYWLTKNLARHGFEPIVVSTGKGIKEPFVFDRWSESEAGRVIYVRTRTSLLPFRQILHSLGNFYRADVVQLSSVFYPAAFATGFAARLFGKKIVWSTRGELSPKALEFSRFRKKPVLWAIKKLIGDYPVYHATCDEEAGFIRDVFGPRAEVVLIPNYIELPPLMPRRAGRFLLHIGRLHPKKAIDNLLRSLVLSKKFADSDLILKLAGTGDPPEYRGKLERLASDLNLTKRVEFLGQVEGESKQQLLADAFWTLMPSHTENFGVVVLESLAQNTPVIAGLGSPWSVLDQAKVGFWIENSPENLAAKIDEIIDMPETEYLNYRARARQFVENEFDISRNLNKWINLYQNLEENVKKR